MSSLDDPPSHARIGAETAAEQPGDGARPEPARRGLFSHYAPGEERPLGSYVVLTGVFTAATGGSLIALRRAGKPLPERVGAGDIVLIGVAAHKLSRLVAKDKVTSFLRAPFTRFQHASGQGEVEEEPCGHGLRLAVGELLVCPYCLSQWAAAGLTLGFVASPRGTRLISSMFAAHTISDFLQIGYRAAEDRV
jgi:hypothetical protein